MSVFNVYLAPNFIFIRVLMLLGFPHKVYSDFCDIWGFGKIPILVYNQILEDLMKDERSGPTIISNRKNYGDNRDLKISQKVREEFAFPQIITQIVDGISNAAVASDPSTWKLPESVTCFLRNLRLRGFIECALLVPLPFYQINRLWKRFNPAGIQHELLDQYSYIFWNIKTVPKMDLRSFLKSNANNPFYHKHLRIVDKGREAFMGEYGLQTDTERKKSMLEIAYRGIRNIQKNTEEPVQTNHSLLALCCTYISRPDRNKADRAGKMPQNPISSFHPYKKSGSNPSAQRVRNSNREYRFKQLLANSIKTDDGVSYE